MKRFLLGILVTFGATAFFAWFAPRVIAWGYAGREDKLGLAVTLVVVPVTVAWLVTEIFQALRPRRVFRGRRRATLFVVGYGMATGFVTLALASVTLAYLDRQAGDAVVVGLSTAVIVAFAVAILGRHRPGHCVVCRYDLRAATLASAGRCAECGEAFAL